ncbi:MAG: CBS domain-containing protein [Cyanobacteria bacterium P01_D01_bin.44]
MNSDNLQAVTPTLLDAIDQKVLTVTPGTGLSKVLQQMSAARSGGSAQLGAVSRQLSCALVVENDRLVGIFTERDIVRMTAHETAFDNLTVGEVMTTPVTTLSESAFQDIFAVLFLFRRYRIRHLPIVDAQERLIGVVTPESIRQVLRPANLLKMRRVADIMSSNVLHTTRETTVLSLAQQMAEHRVSCIVIVDIDSEGMRQDELKAITPVGIVTERDIVQFQALQLSLHTLTAQDVMSSPLFLLSPDDSLWAAHQEMQRRRVRRLVVSWNWGNNLGLVTQTSLLKVFDPIEMYSIIESLQRTLHQIKDVERVPQPAAVPGADSPVEAGLSPSINHAPQAKTGVSTDIPALLLDIETRLLCLTDPTQFSAEQQQELVQGALMSLQQVQAALT